MNKYALSDIRQQFLGYFGARGHAVVPSSPLVPRDPTLLFTNAGMVPFKDVFTGAETRSYTRAASAQKCVRAGGKHNDLENVGYTARHHTFFEMLGNFSFGDYFKEEAIKLAWEMVTKDFALPPAKLLVTVFHDDDEAAELWRKIAGLPDHKIIRIAGSANFWRMGDSGPCGPCSELFIDQGEALAGGPPGSPDEDGDRFLEFWNLVFMQYEDTANGERRPLPRPSVDTGMGLERIAAILQGVTSNYDTDLFRAIINAASDVLRAEYVGDNKASFRVIADHMRAIVFLINDGVLPANEGRGYVLRRIMRRAMRHAHILGANEPVLYKLVTVISALMSDMDVNLKRAEPLAVATLQQEESRFIDVLQRGLKVLDKEAAALAAGGALPGRVAFQLYDTFGFPVDLTQDILRGRGLKLDTVGFDAAMAEQKARARAAWTGTGDAGTDRIFFDIREEVGGTEFLGYITDEAEAVVQKLVRFNAHVADAECGTDISIIVNQTPFYGESGGQIGDTGMLTTATGAEVEINDTQRQAESLIVHHGRVIKGTLRVGDIVRLKIDVERRACLRANHSATHLLHAALRKKLGEHVTQKGSRVMPDRLRFDFSHNCALSTETLAQIERMVNERIWANDELITRLMTPQDAVASGAMALFGEKYGDEVRVVSMGGSDKADTTGAQVDDKAANNKQQNKQQNGQQNGLQQDINIAWSVELCGGTHVKRLGDIGAFHIISESAVAAGVRRIEAVTRQGVISLLQERGAVLQSISSTLNAPLGEIVSRIGGIIDERKKLEREVAELRRKVALSGNHHTARSTDDTRRIGDVSFIGRVLEGIPPNDLKPMVDELKAQIGSGVVALVSVYDGKASLVVGVTADLLARIDAVKLTRAGVAALGGKGGGGRPDMAQGGGSDVAQAAKAIEEVAALLAA